MNDFKRAVLLFFLTLLVCAIVPFVTALTPPSGGVSYYNFSSVTDLWGSYDGTAVGTPSSSANYPVFNISGSSSPSSYDFDGTNDYVTHTDTILPTGNKSISFWFTTNYTSAFKVLMTNGYAESGTGRGVRISIGTGGIMTLESRNGVSGQDYFKTTTTVTTGKWYHFVFVQDDDNSLKLYVNGTLISTDSTPTGTEIVGDYDFTIGASAYTGHNYRWNGLIDEIKIFNRPLNTTEVGNLYNYGNITGPTTTANFSVSVTDFWDGGAVNNINVTVDGVSYLNVSGNTVTTHLLQNDSNLYDVYVATTSLSHFPRNYINTDVTSNLVAELYATDIKFRVYEYITGDELTANITIEGVTKGVNESFYLDVDNNILAEVSVSGYYPLNYTFNTTYQQNNTLSITGLYDSIINFSSVAAFTGLTITNFSVNTSESGLLSTTNGTIYLPTIQGYNQSYTVLNSVYVTETSSIITNTSWTNLSVILYDFNSVNINIYDGITGNLLNQSVGISVINNETSFNVSTVTGVYNLSLLQPLAHELRFTSLNYNPQSYFLTVTNDSTQSINVYMTMNTSNSPQLVRILDVGGTFVSGAVVWLQEQVINSTDLWVTIQQAETNFLGETVVYVERDTNTFYRFGVVFNGDFVPISPNNNLFTTKTFFLPGVDGIDNPIIIVVNTASTIDNFITEREDIVTSGGVSGLLNNTVWCSWADPNNAISGARIIVSGKKLLTNFSFEILHDASSSSTSGNLSYTFPIINNTVYITNCYLLWASSEEVFFIDNSNFDTSTGGMDKNTGILYAVLIVLTCALLTLSFGAIGSGIFVVISLFVVRALGLMNLPVVVITTFLAIVIIGFVSFNKSGVSS